MKESCFDKNVRDEYTKCCINGKCIYIFADHSTAILPWFEISQQRPVSLITFDKHTDTDYPLYTYNAVYQKGDQSLAVQLLEALSMQLNADEIRGILRENDRLKITKDHAEGALPCHARLQYTEQITTSIYWGFLQRAFICSPSESKSQNECKVDEFRNIYNNIIYMSGVFKNQTLDDESINAIYKSGLSPNEEYILDIDLDYFDKMSTLESICKDSKFADLLRNAKAITIATEPSCVLDEAEELQQIYDDIEDKEKVGLLASQRRLDVLLQKIKDVLDDADSDRKE